MAAIAERSPCAPCAPVLAAVLACFVGPALMVVADNLFGRTIPPAPAGIAAYVSVIAAVVGVAGLVSTGVGFVGRGPVRIRVLAAVASFVVQCAAILALARG